MKKIIIMLVLIAVTVVFAFTSGEGEKTPIVEKVPIIKEAPIVEETPIIKEAPIVEETPIIKEAPIVEETPIIKEVPIVKETPIIDKDRVVERVAILPFTGGEDHEGDIVAQMLGTELTKLGYFQVVPRTAAIEKVMEEHNFQRGGLTDGDTIVELGKGANAKYVISGHIQSLGNRKMISASIVDVETFQQVAGGYYEYNDLSEVRAYLPELAKKIATGTEKDYSGVPTLAILPFDSNDENISDVLAQLLAIELANSGKYVVVSRTTTIENVMKEQNIQRSGITDSDTMAKLGIAMNADYVLSGSAYNLGSTGIMQVQIIDVLSLVQENGAYVEYRTIEDGARLMPTLSYDLTGVGEKEAKVAFVEQENVIKIHISPNGGTFVGRQVVTLSCTIKNTKIYYTTNSINPDPTDSTQLYTGAFTINAGTTINAIGVKEDYADSAIATAKFTQMVATPIVNPNGKSFVGSQEVILLSTTPNTRIYYTTNGIDPDPTDITQLYRNAFIIDTDTTVKIIGVREGYIDSAVKIATFTQTVASPIISPNGGTFVGSSQEVSLSCVTTGAMIYYTTDGSDPGLSDNTQLYTGAFTINAATTIKAISLKERYADSAIVTAKLTRGLFETVFVEGGTFTSAEKEITVSSFYMGTYEVTQKQYFDVTGKNPSKNQPDTGWENLPVDTVDWYSAIEFCNKLSEQEGLDPCYVIDGKYTTCDFDKNGYRLPTEAEWEYAARGGKHKSDFTYAGSNTLSDVAWYSGNGGKTRAVGTKKPNALGLYDMSGNVWERCWDWFERSYPSSTDNPTGPDWGAFRSSIRGGSYQNSSSGCRVSYRGGKLGSTTTIGYNNSGFRVVRSSRP